MAKHAITWRQRVDSLPARYDHLIFPAMDNAYELGYREDADDDGEAFWHEVYGQVVA
jgi:hypothetical protein